jgi:hypothetical protein
LWSAPFIAAVLPWKYGTSLREETIFHFIHLWIAFKTSFFAIPHGQTQYELRQNIKALHETCLTAKRVSVAATFWTSIIIRCRV